MSEMAQSLSPGAERVAAWIDRLVHGLARHWLLIFNLLVGLYLALPLAAPWLMHNGHTGAGRLIYLLYRPMCHQLPDRSFFLFGERAVYSLEELDAAGVLPGLALYERRQFVGNDRLGYKVAICQRDVATWGAILLTGLLFGLRRRRWRPLTLRWYVLFLVPLALDGATQLLGLRESNWVLRTITGGLFGVATVCLAYPLVERAMEEIWQERRKDTR